MPTAAQIRESLLALCLAAASPPSVALQHRLYRAAIAIVPPTDTNLRALGTQRMESDEALLAAFTRGDAAAFEALMGRHLEWMVAWASKHLPASDAEDAAQEAFIALVRKAPGLQLESPLRGYLFGLLRIQVLRGRRTLQRRQDEDEALDDGEVSVAQSSSEPSPAMKVLARRAHDEIAEAMHRVCNLREQEVLLFDLEDANDNMIAAALDTTEGNIRVIRHRALAKLRKALAGSVETSATGNGHGH